MSKTYHLTLLPIAWSAEYWFHWARLINLEVGGDTPAVVVYPSQVNTRIFCRTLGIYNQYIAGTEQVYMAHYIACHDGYIIKDRDGTAPPTNLSSGVSPPGSGNPQGRARY